MKIQCLMNILHIIVITPNTNEDIMFQHKLFLFNLKSYIGKVANSLKTQVLQNSFVEDKSPYSDFQTQIFLNHCLGA